MEHRAVSTSQKRHAVCIPYPAQGHINPMLKLAKLLHSKGFHVTFVNTDYNHRRILRSHGPRALDGHRSFRFETIPDGLPWTDVDDKQDMLKLIDSTINNCLTPFKELLHRLNSGFDKPPVTCIVSDASMSFTIDAAEEFQIPVILLWTNSATAFNLYLHYQKLIEKKIIPRTEIDLKNHLEIEIDWIPSLKKIKLKDFPGFVTTTDPKDPMIDFILHVTGRSNRASAILINTFDYLESNVIESLQSLLLQNPQIYPIGPIQFLEYREIDSESEIGKLRLNLWVEKEEEEEEIRCFDWLDSKAKETVLYVNFGSLTMLTKEQLMEFAWGLAGSGKEFLWVVRSGTVDGDASIFPAEFRSETANRGMLINGWSSQEKVLSHPSIGGFLTHCGWNSTMESLFAGVPMICWPFFADQITNRKFCCDEWEIGMEIGDEVKREKVEAVVREIMDGEKGKMIREMVVKWRSMAEEATEPPSGSSYVNFETVVNKVL